MLTFLADATVMVQALSMDFSKNTPLQSITLYLFFAGTVAMGAGALYFFLLRNNVEPVYRSTMVVAGLVCAIACFHYFKMTHVYQESGGKDFPTALRYVDWLFTTPLLLIKFPLLLRMGDRGTKFFFQLVVLDVAMIATAFIAETSEVNSERWWTFFLVACVCEAMIVGVLFMSLGQAITEAPAPLARSLETMRLFILIGWAVYPIGFLMARSGNGEFREIVYNISDVINKVGFGLVAYHGIQAMSHSQESHGRA